MHPNVFMKLSSELQVRCHLSKVQLRNFWTWIQMILRIFCGNKGTVLPFSYWICCFCRFQSAPDFLRSWAFTATSLASACDFSSWFVSCWLQIGGLEALNRTCDFSSSNLFRFFGLICIYIESTWKRIKCQFFALTTGLFGILWFSDYTLETLKTPRKRIKKTWYISALSW